MKKQLNFFVIKSFLGPFVLTFVIAIFVLLMQWLWKYIDDLVGKGLEWTVVTQLLFWASTTMIPLALPLAILLSSIMTFGNLGEHYELVALKIFRNIFATNHGAISCHNSSAKYYSILFFEQSASFCKFKNGFIAL